MIRLPRAARTFVLWGGLHGIDGEKGDCPRQPPGSRIAVRRHSMDGVGFFNGLLRPGAAALDAGGRTQQGEGRMIGEHATVARGARLRPAAWWLTAAIAIAVLLALDGPVSRLARSIEWAGDVRRELELLQQYGGPASMAIAAAVIWLLDPPRRRRLADWLVAAGSATALASLLKLLIGRPRPALDAPGVFLGPWAAYPFGGDMGSRHAWELGSGISSSLWSMPSSHAAVAVVMSVFLGRLYPGLTPLAVALAILVGTCRVLLGAHYPTDVVAGGLLGYLVATRVMRDQWGTRLVDRARASRPYLPGSVATLRAELRHLGAVAGHTFRLLLDHNEVANTQLYGSHLCQVTCFRELFRAHLRERPERIARWTRRQVFIDYEPDYDALGRLPAETLGRHYHRLWSEHRAAGRPELRALRLQTLPEEACGLDQLAAVPTADDDRAFAHVVARRNLFSSAAHDYHHVLLGADTSPAGEALVGRYEYRHLLEPGRLMNTVNAVVLLALTGRWRALFAVWRGFRVIRATPDPAGIDGEALWDQPLSAVRRRLGLPADGLMRSGR